MDKRKIIGITIISAMILILSIVSITLYLDNENLKIQVDNIEENADQLLKDNIDILTQENIQLRNELLLQDDTMGEKAVELVNTYLELFYKRHNTQPHETQAMVKPYISEKVLKQISGSNIDDSTLHTIDFGNTIVEQWLIHANTFFRVIDNKTIAVLSNVRVGIAINHQEEDTNYLYEFRVELQDNNELLITEIVTDMTYWEID